MASGFHLTFFLCLICGLFISESTSLRFYSVCPSGWTRYGSRCFSVQTRRQTMADAERTCIALGGNLASVHSHWEHNFIRRLIYQRCRSYPSTWIGLFDAIQERRWMWTDGTKVNYTCWSRREPNNLRRREHCTEMRYGSYWNDHPCYYRKIFVCAKRP